MSMSMVTVAKMAVYCDECEETPCQCSLKVCGQAFSCCIHEEE